VLGLVYLWYPWIVTDGGEVGALAVLEERMKNEALRSAIEQQAHTEEDQSSDFTLQSTSTHTEDVLVEEVPPPAQAEELPQTVNLPVPFTSQAPEGNWEQPWQDACEEAAILMLDAYYKKYNLSPLFAKDELQKMVDWQTERNLGYSIPLIDLSRVAQWYMGNSFSFAILEQPTIERIQESVANGNPVLVVAYGKALDNPNFTGNGPEYHVLIIRGYTPEGFITNDPGTRNGEGFFYTYENLMGSIHDWNGGDVAHGDPVVLVRTKNE